MPTRTWAATIPTGGAARPPSSPTRSPWSARAERFHLRHPGVTAVFALAAERRLPVIIPSGLGIPSLGRDALTLGDRYPEAPLVLAHVGVTDLAWIWRRLGEHPSIFFDTAWWNPADHLALFALVPPSRILLG